MKLFLKIYNFIIKPTTITYAPISFILHILFITYDVHIIQILSYTMLHEPQSAAHYNVYYNLHTADRNNDLIPILLICCYSGFIINL